jgi:hypothetical protein
MEGGPTRERRQGATLLAGGAVLLALLSLSAVFSQESASLDVSGYPADQQRRYKVFADKCSRCHDLSRPLTAKYSDAGWRDLVQRMARRPGANINRRDQQQIWEFLIFHSRQARPGSAAPAGDPAEASVAPAAAPVTLGQAAQGGIRVEVSARRAQAFVQLTGGKWVQTSPGAGENTYLEVRVFDAESGEKIPYAVVKARFQGESGEGPETLLSPVYGPEGFHYGANFAAQPPLRVQVTIEPPAVTRVGDGAARWLAPITLQFTVGNGAGG